MSGIKKRPIKDCIIIYMFKICQASKHASKTKGMMKLLL